MITLQHYNKDQKHYIGRAKFLCETKSIVIDGADKVFISELYKDEEEEETFYVNYYGHRYYLHITDITLYKIIIT